MKLHLPVALFTALLAALPLTQTLRAETLFATGATTEQLVQSSRFSDTGKGCYFNESYNYYQPYKGAEELYKENGNWDFMGPQLAPSVNRGSSSVSGALGGLTHDVSMCWANATANVMQYWQSYYGIFYDDSNGALPYGWNYAPELAETLGGSQSLSIYNEFYRHWYDEGGTFKWASDWYCRRVDPSRTYIKDEGTGGWWENWFGESHAYSVSYYNGSSNIKTLTNNFAAALGYTAQADGTWAQTTVGQIGYLGISSYLGGHALTCWGMETDENNLVKAIYIANSDDLSYQLVKLYLKSVDGQYYLFSDEECTEYWNWNAANWYLDEVSYLNTPQTLKDLYRAYSSAELTWTGAAAEWSEASSADRRIGYELPGSTAGWTLTVQGKSYDSYFDTRRNVRFDDGAARTDIRTGGQLTAGNVVLANSKQTYTFTAGKDGCNLTADSITAETNGSAVFNGMDTAANTLLLNGYSLTVQNGTLGAGTATLQGGTALALENSTATFADLLLGSGTVLTLDLSRAGDETALMSISGTMVTEGGLTLNVHNLPTDLSELYMVISAGRYDESTWNSQSVTLNGAAADQLFWRDGVLYFGSYVDKQHQYFTAHTAAPEKWRKFEGVSFTGIRYQGNGAALTNAESLRLEKNGPVLFEDNRATGSGGAVANSGTLAAEGNKSITFRRNQATETGGAVANTGGVFSITGSQNVLFDANSALAGGALYQSGGSTAVSGNGSVTFINNRSTEAGGALMNEGGTLQLTGNEALSFTANHADGNGGAVYNAGGRLSVSGGASFTRNSAGGQGGAVYNAYDGRIALNADTGDIIFRGNTQGSGSNTVLRAIHSQGDLNSDDLKESVSAAAGHSIIFYDAVQVENSSWFGQTNFNTEGRGSIVFSGRYAAEDLQNITGSAPTAAALRDSRSSVFTGSIYLAGGTLRIEDGASLTTGSLYTADGAVPVTIALANGELHTPNYSLTFGTFKALELTGTNTVETSYMAFFDESTLTFNLSAEHASTAALTVISPDRFDMQGNLTLNLNGTDTLADGRYKLIETSHGVLWDCNLTLNGGYEEALSWENGTLWYDAAYIPIPVPSTDLVFEETLSGSFSYIGNDSLTFITGKSRAIDETGSDPAEVLLAENGSLTIRDITAAGSGGAIANVSHGADSPSVIVLEGNGPIDFNTVKAADDGGIIANTALNGGEARMDFRRNGAMQLLGGRAAEGRGGAVFNAGQLNMADNGEIMLGDSSAAKDGGAVYNAAGGQLSISDNGGLNLARNASDGRGGAVANYGELHLDGNNYIVATGNYSLYGAALYNEGRLTMDGNGYIQFAGNDCVDNTGDYSEFGIGGNICNSAEGDISICDNGNVSLSSTYAMYGGGMYNEGRVTIANNRDVNMDSNSTEGNGGAVFNYGGTFVLSRNRNVTFNEDWAWGGYGGTICNMAGTVELNANESLSVYSSYCALSNGNTSAVGEAVMNIIGNGDIVFYDNISYQTKDRFKGKAGAVYNHANGTLNICGNGNVVFYNNTILQFAEASPTGKDRSYLHALHNEGTLNLSAAAGKSITFYDGIDSAAGSAVNLNAVFTDAEGQVQTATGDIVFSGLRAESILRSNMLAEYVTPEVIAMSKTSTLETEVNLCGGRLRVEDDARLITNALTARAGSGSTVRLSGASLTAKDALTLQSGTSLQVEGVNSITAGTVNMQAGSTLAFEVGKINLTQSALTLAGKLNTDHITLSFIGTEDLQEGSTYALLTAQSYPTSAWTAGNITISTNGVLWEDLEWRNGTLYLNFAKHAAAVTLTWNNASGDGIWQANSANWGGKDIYTDGAEVIFADKGVGTVTLVGDLAPKSVLVDSSGDYLFAGKGKLTGNTSLTKQGQGTLTITTANDYTGMTTVNGGTLVAGNARALGSGIVVLNGGTLEIAANGVCNELTVAGHSALQVNTGYQFELNKQIANNGVLTVSGTVDASALTLNTTAATHLDVNGNSGASGFAKSAGYSVQLVNGGTTVNNGAAVMHGNHSLTLNSDGSATSDGVVDYGTYLLTGSDAAASSAIHAVSSKASVSMNGGTLTVNDAVSVNATGGSIALKGGTLNGTLSGTAITAASGTLAATLNGSNTLNGNNYALQRVITNSGTLTIGGSLDASALALKTTAATHIDVNGKSGANGFTKTAAYSVQLVDGGTTVNNKGTVKHGTRTLTLNSNGTATAGGTVNYGTYLLTSTGTASTSAIHAMGSKATVKQTGGTLTVDDTATVTATAGKIALNGGTLNGTLSGTDITATSGTIAATLNGSNTLNGNNYALQRVITNSGTLTIGGTLDVSALTLITTAATHLDVNGNSGDSGFLKVGSASVQLVSGGTTVNNNATVKHGNMTLTLNSNGTATSGGTVDYGTYLLTGTDTATTAAIHGVSSTAAISQTGGTLTVNDTAMVNATAGNILLSGGTLNGTLRGTTVTAASGTLAAALSGNNTLNADNYALQRVITNSGTLTIGGSLDASALSLKTTAATHIDVNGKSGASGFAKTSGYSVQLVSGGTTVNNNATIKHGTRTLSLNSNGTATSGGTVDYGTYLLTGTGTASTAAIHGVSSTATVKQTGGTLTVNDTATVNATAGKITLSGGTLNGTLRGTTITATSGTLAAALSGNNTLNADNYALQRVITNSGTLTVSGALDVSALTLNTITAAHYDVNGNSGASGFADISGYSVQVVSGGTTVNKGATVRHGALTLTLNGNGTATARTSVVDYGTYLVTGKDTASTAAIHGVNSAAVIGLSGGTLTVDDTATVNATAGNVLLNGGTLNGTVSGTAVTAVSGTIAAELSGSTKLVKNDVGALAVTSANTYSGGTVINGGTVDVWQNNALGTGAVTMNGGTLNLNGRQLAQNSLQVSDEAVLAAGNNGYVKSLTVKAHGVEAAGGKLLHADTLTLSGTLKTDSLHVQKGRIQGGSIEIAGKTEVQQGYVGSNLTGTELEKTGGGLVELAGRNVFTNGMTVAGGELALLEGGSTLADITVGSGSSLLAAHTVDGHIHLANGAAMYLRPGATYELAGHSLSSAGGTLHGSLNMGGGSATELSGKGLTVTHHAALAGGSLTYADDSAQLAVAETLTLAAPTKLSGNWNKTSPYTIMSAGRILNTSGKSLYALFDLSSSAYSLSQNGTTLVLTPKQVKAALARMAQEPQASPVPHTFAPTRPGDETAPAATPRLAAEQNEAAAAAPRLAAEQQEADTGVDCNHGLITAMAVRRVADCLVQADWGVMNAARMFSASLRQHITPAAERRSAVWAEALGGVTRQSSHGGYAGSDTNLTGGAVGVETVAGESATPVGFGFGYMKNRSNTFGMQGIHQEALQLGLYAAPSLQKSGITYSLQLAAAYGRTDSHGTVQYSREQWKQDSLVLSARGNVGTESLSGFAGVEYAATSNGRIDDVRTGAVQNLQGEVGVRSAATVGRAAFYAEAAFTGDIVRHNPGADLGGLYYGANPGRLGGRVSVGASYTVSDAWAVHASYSVEGAKHRNSHNAVLGTTYKF